jgi:hypothetical protein
MGIGAGTAALALAAIGTATAVYGQVQAGNAQAANARYQSQVAANNAKIAQQNQVYAIQAGEAKAQAQSLRGAALSGRVRAALAANGVDVNSGSPLDVETGVRRAGELDTLTTMNNAALQAYGYRAAASTGEGQAGLLAAQAGQAQAGAAIGAAGTLLNNASSLGFKWGAMQSSGGGGGGTEETDFSASYGEGPSV